jgi:5-methylcytosine-specific restriction enzyme subunit McrC
MIIYRAQERQQTGIPISLLLTDGALDINPEIQSSKYFDVSLNKTELIIRAGKFVGFVPLNDRVGLEVSPKFPRANLMRMLFVAGNDVQLLEYAEREYDFDDSAFHVPPLLRAIAGTFARAAADIETEGLLKRYIPITGSDTPRGRINLERTIQDHWSRGHRHKLTSTAATLTADIPENQLLLTATLVFLRYINSFESQLHISTVTSLAHFAELLERAIAPTTTRESRALRINVTGRTPAYKRAIAIASAFLAGRGVIVPDAGTEITLSSILIDMESLFEQYVRTILRHSLMPRVVLDGNRTAAKPLFDDRPKPQAQPDIVVKSAGAIALVGDVKYKPRYSREDINQVVTYALSYRCRKAMIFLPSVDNTDPVCEVIGHISEITLYAARLKISSEAVDAMESSFAGTVRDVLDGTFSSQTI